MKRVYSDKFSEEFVEYEEIESGTSKGERYYEGTRDNKKGSI